MKYTNIIILSIVICIGGILFVIASKATYETKKSEVERKAKEAFVKTLDQELKSRNFKGDVFYRFFNAESALTATIPDSVCMEDTLGKRWYKLDPNKHRMNITNDSNIRFLHSIVFKEKPINPDSLNKIWNSYLQECDIYSKSALCVSITGHDAKVKSQSSMGCEWCSLSNFVFAIYLGYACEIEIIGYLNYSLWKMLYLKFLFFSLLYSTFVYGIYRLSLIVIAKMKPIYQKVFIEVPVIEIVKEVSNIPVRSYILHENVIFYAEQRIIEVDGKKKKMPLQACLLLELFLNAEDYILTDDEIMNKLWPDGSGHLKRVHKAIARLRSYLSVEPSILIERENSDTYQLII